MGRPLIYICAVTIVVLGIMQININSRHIALAKRTANYANGAEMRNLAHAGVEYTLNKLRKDPDWRNSYDPYEVPLDYGSAFVTIQDYTTNASLTEEQLKLISKGSIDGQTVEISYLVEMVLGQLPSIPGALALTDPKFLNEFQGSYEINGFDAAFENSETDSIGIPGISVVDDASKQEIIDSSTEIELSHITGNSPGIPSIKVDPTMDYPSLSKLIDQLAPYSTQITDDVKDDLGAPEAPGVFFVENPVAVRGNVNGYGILVVKETGGLDLSELDIAGNFDFYGLVIFRNSLRFVGKGDAYIHGTTVIGSPGVETNINIDLTGNLTIQYDSEGLEYARSAAKNAVPASFVILDIYE